MKKKRPTAGLFDVQHKQAKLAKLNDVLIRLKAQVDWDGFRPVVEEVFPLRDQPKGGQPPYDRLMLFKMLVLCRLYHLSAEALEYQVNDRRSFQDFLDLEPQHEVPDATTVRLFAKHLVDNGTMPKLFAHFHARLEQAGLVLNEGKIVDASIVDAPIQRNCREENERIKENDVPEDWSDPKRRQKDVDATWTKKHGKSYFGYKNHVKVDAGSKLIDHYVVTSASVHDGTVVWDLLTEADRGQEFDADKAYDSAHTKEGVRLAQMKYRVLKQPRRNKPLTERDKRYNTDRSRVRARVEHVFGAMNKQLGGLRVSCIGLARATFQVGLTNLCYNFLRSLTLLKNPQPWGACDPTQPKPAIMVGRSLLKDLIASCPTRPSTNQLQRTGCSRYPALIYSRVNLLRPMNTTRRSANRHMAIKSLLLAIGLTCGAGAKAQIVDTTHIVYRVYGLPPDLLTQCAERIAASEMGFEFLSVGGCLVADDVRKEVSRQNKQADSLLALKRGKDWEKQFDRRIDEERARIVPIDSLARLTSEFSSVKDSLGVHGSLWVFISKGASGDYLADLSTLDQEGDGIKSVRQIVFSPAGVRRR